MDKMEIITFFELNRWTDLDEFRYEEKWDSGEGLLFVELIDKYLIVV